MKFIAIIRDISYADQNGVGHPSRDLARSFESGATIGDVWTWYEKTKSWGILVLVPDEATEKGDA